MLGATVGLLQVVAFIGHAGELWVVMGNGGFDAPEEVFDHPTHVAFANFTPVALLVAVLVVIAATAAWAVQRRRAAVLP